MRNEYQLDKIKTFLADNINETKGLDQWRVEINHMFPSRKRLTKRQIAFIFNRHIKDKRYSVQYDVEPISYTFLPLL